MDRSLHTTRAERGRWALLARLSASAAVLAVAVSCGLFQSVPVVARSGWDPDLWGPVVPHDSFPADCGICHVTETWTEIKLDFRFDHGAETGVPLLGAHAQGACLRCHNDRGPVQQFAALGCRGCHVDPHEGALGDQCATCHDERTWSPQGTAAIHLEVGFPLYGSHAATSCDQCHPGSRSQDFRGAPNTCVGCHAGDTIGVVSPDHTNLTDCEQCHSVFVWEDAVFPHDTFPLVGGHAGVDCARCHPGNQFMGTPRNCVACHQDDYAATANPNHLAGGFSTDCEACHTINGWRPASFDHSTWPLTGAHQSTACTQCHQNGVYTGTPRDCNACHQQDYAQTRDPQHATLGFPTTCDECHTTTAWEPAQFAHTSYPLEGAHQSTSCNACHQNGVYAGTPRTCSACHQQDYAQTSDPNHTSLGFPTTCEACHTPVAWRPGSFDHSTWPLTGQHQVITCNNCHFGGTYAGTPRACSGCHQDDYNGTTNPNHTSAGFPTTCDSCHTTSTWKGATFTHTFDIKNGAHKIFNCSDCHTNPGNYAVFTCTACHLKPKMDDVHKERAGYQYLDASCLSCHPTGR